MTDAFPKIVSVDDHVIEPPHLFSEWLPAKYRSMPEAPRVERHGMPSPTFAAGRYIAAPSGDGPPCDFWHYEDLYLPLKRTIAAVGFTRDAMTLAGVTYDEMRPGYYEPKARLADMDQNWVDISLCFPTFARFCGQTFSEAHDRDLALACVRAYNDWMVEEWCGDSGGRLVPLCLIPLWDAELAAAEVRRNAARGVRAVAFSEGPAALGLPSVHDANRYWDPFFAACSETNTVICMHTGSSSRYATTSDDAPGAVAATLQFEYNMQSLVDFLFSGVLVRFPDLDLAYSEGQIGWIPYILERVDEVWNEHYAHTGVRETVPEPPSRYFHRQVYGCFFKDDFGLSALSFIGEDRVCYETDYPHVASGWPESRQIAEQMTRDLSAETTHKIIRGNGLRLLRRPPDQDTSTMTNATT
jgi:predicted TIM-barrel fold metal-dependent hydrolase